MKGRVSLPIGGGETIHAKPESFGDIIESAAGVRVYVGDRWLNVETTVVELETAIDAARAEQTAAGSATV